MVQGRKRFLLLALLMLSLSNRNCLQLLGKLFGFKKPSEEKLKKLRIIRSVVLILKRCESSAPTNKGRHQSNSHRSLPNTSPSLY